MVLIRLYAGLWMILMPFMRLWLSWRIIKGKEQRDRIPERFGKASVARPDGKLIWLHAASVGEAVSALSLVKSIFEKQQDIYFLITSGTTTSAKMIAVARSNSEYGSQLIHQMQPLDAPNVVKRFLKYWRPDILFLLESDLWPMMIWKTHQNNIPVIMASAQISDKSMQRWQRINSATRKIIFSSIIRIEAIDEEQANRFRQITEPEWTEITISGSLKASAPPPKVDTNIVEQLNQMAQDRTVVMLASSHPGEDEIIVEAIEAIQQSEPILLILVPRHIERGKHIHAMLKQRDLSACLLSQAIGNSQQARDISSDAMPAKRKIQICIADMMGQMGSFYTAADIVIMGGGFMPLGGHNPMEPAALGKGVISGRNIDKNIAIYNRLDEFSGVLWADSPNEIASAIILLMTAPTRLKHLNSGALSAYQSFTQQGDAVADKVLALLASSQASPTQPYSRKPV